MSRPDGQLSPAQAEVLRLLGPVDGRRIPGGCDQCDAYQTVTVVEAGLFVMTVHHDDNCSFLRAYEKRRRHG